jgi:hypothetical protein
VASVGDHHPTRAAKGGSAAGSSRRLLLPAAGLAPAELTGVAGVDLVLPLGDFPAILGG